MEECLIEINKSKFYGYKFELYSLDDVNKILAELKKQHKKATHICYAYVYSRECVREKACDDGEPNGTAGYPILNVIKMKKLTNTLIAVVRYFCGIKLGAGGLSRAYAKTAGSLFT